jgi:hypothetical protein
VIHDWSVIRVKGDPEGDFSGISFLGGFLRGGRMVRVGISDWIR